MVLLERRSDMNRCRRNRPLDELLCGVVSRAIGSRRTTADRAATRLGQCGHCLARWFPVCHRRDGVWGAFDQACKQTRRPPLDDPPFAADGYRLLSRWEVAGSLRCGRGVALELEIVRFGYFPALCGSLVAFTPDSQKVLIVRRWGGGLPGPHQRTRRSWTRAYSSAIWMAGGSRTFQ